MPPGHRAIDHTADLAFELWADDLPSLLAEAARAIVEILTDHATVPSTDRRSIELDAFDDEDRLVRWLNEVIWLALGEGFVVADAALESTETGLVGLAFGTLDPALVVTEVKSATYHDLTLVRERDQLRARVVLDV
jgi:SHS2 domain-containing protein